MPIQQRPVPTPEAPALPGVAQPGTAPKAATQDYNALSGRLREYQKQLSNAENRREGVIRAIQRSDEQGRIALNQRLAGLDKQILQLDADIAQTSRLVAEAAPPSPPPFTSQPPPYNNNRNNNNDEGPFIVATVFTIFVLMPVAVAYARRIWKRPTPQMVPTGWNDSPARLERVEHAVDTIAVEIERISESQRFMTRLMTETQLGSAVASVRASADAAREAVAEPMEGPQLRALGAGEKPFEPLKVAEREEVRIRRDA